MNIDEWKKINIAIEDIDLNDISLSTALYLRVSTEKQEKNESLEFQELEGIEYIKNKKYNLFGIYRDVISGGSHIRQGIDELIEEIQKNNIKRVIFVNAERLARDITFAINFANICTMNKVIIEFADSEKRFYKFNLMELMEYILTFFKSHAQREQISIDVKRRMGSKMATGQRMGARAPFGYRWKDKKLVIHPEESKIVKLIYQDFINGDSRNEIGKRYNKSNTFVTRIIENPTFMGKNTFGQRSRDKKTNKVIYRDEYIISDGEHEAIIDENTWKIAHEILKKSIKPKVKNENNPRFLLSGLLYCFCGCKMYGWSKDEKNHYYSCATRNLRKDRKDCDNKSKKSNELEKAVFDALINLSENVKDVTVKSEKVSNIVKIEVLETEIKNLEKQKKDLLDLVGIFSIEDIKIKKTSLEKNIISKKEEILQLKNQAHIFDQTDKIRLKSLFEKVFFSMKNENRMQLKKDLPLLIYKIEFINNFRFKIILNMNLKEIAK